MVAKIAAKSLKAGTTDAEKREEFLLEARFMMNVHHAHIVNLYGVCTVGEPVLIVSELCDHGNLQSHLTKATSRFTIRSHLQFMRECCSALGYLEDNDFIHRYGIRSQQPRFPSSSSLSGSVSSLASMRLAKLRCFYRIAVPISVVGTWQLGTFSSMLV